ncbi:glutathione S-transferase [alpha proteobacterium BAL199]|jgi:glutathione S-transferase|nr:glutathione S-transferase [alpha proteobacterium BAL199]
MLTLYDYLPSQNAYKVRLLLNHLATPYRTKLVSIFEGEGQSDDYLALNPTGAVPTIELDDGRTLAESNAILTFLAEGTRYLPVDPYNRATVLQWLFFEADYVQSSIATLRLWVQTGKDQHRGAELIAHKRAASMRALAVLDRALVRTDFLGGTDYTIADISVFAYVHRADEANLPLSRFANVTRWIEAVRRQARFLDQVHPFTVDPHSHREIVHTVDEDAAAVGENQSVR